MYKAMKNDIVVDILKDLYYVRYLPKAKRWVGTDAQSAHGIMSSDKSVIYHMAGRAHTCPDHIETIDLVEIDQREYDELAETFAVHRKETEDLRNEIGVLKNQLEEQNSLLQAILSKL